MSISIVAIAVHVRPLTVMFVKTSDFKHEMKLISLQRSEETGEMNINSTSLHTGVPRLPRSSLW